jgi:hypothetical protein
VIQEEGLSASYFLAGLDEIDELRSEITRVVHIMGKKSAVSGACVPSEKNDTQAESTTSNILDQLNGLYLRLIGLRSSLRQNSIPTAEKEMKKCLTMAANLGEAIKSLRANPHLFFAHMQRVNELVIDINDDIDRLKNVWWRKAWRSIKSNLISFAKPVANLLGVPTGPKLIEYVR